MGKNRILYLADYCLTPFERIDSVGLLCENGQIIAMGGASAFSMYEEGLSIVEMKGSYALPGLIDSHIHGIGLQSTRNAANGTFSLNEMSRSLSRHGVTTFIAALVPQPVPTMLKSIENIAEQIEQGNPDSAECSGIHIEGPFLNPEKRGSIDASALRKIDLGLAAEIIAAGHSRIKVMTFAPELENAPELIELLLQNGITPSMGHSLATVDETVRCIDAGARRCTYIFNGMPPLYHRSANLTTIALTDDRVSVEIIVDGVHVRPRMIDIVARCKPKDKLIGISNAVSNGVEEDKNATKDPSIEVVRTEDGIIAGSTLTLENSWHLFTHYAGIPQAQASLCFTSNPAQDLGLITRGVLAPGKRADITFFDTRTNRVSMTVSRGEIIYRQSDNQ